ncbi:MAG: ribosomal protein S18-alanine N-acetyltransferase [Pseudomonadota bacterium]
MLLRAMTAGDLPSVIAIERASQPVPWTEGMLRDCLRADYWNTVAVDHDGTVAGFVVLSSGGGDAHVLNIAVDPRYRRRGIARRLLASLMEAARLREADQLFLEVRAGNEPALTLYRDLGFAEVAVRRAYYPRVGGGREDAIIMARVL